MLVSPDTFFQTCQNSQYTCFEPIFPNHSTLEATLLTISCQQIILFLVWCTGSDLNRSDVLTYGIVHGRDGSLQLPSLSPACALALTMAHARFFFDKQNVFVYLVTFGLTVTMKSENYDLSLSIFTIVRPRASLFTQFSIQFATLK